MTFEIAVKKFNNNTLIIPENKTGVLDDELSNGEGEGGNYVRLAYFNNWDEQSDINKSILEYKNRITNIKFNNELQKIHKFSFVDYTNLKTIDLSNTQVASIGYAAFQNCGITDVKIPSSIIELGPFSFFNCTNLTNVVFNGATNLKSIGMYAFANCSKLETFTVPNGVTELDVSAFQSSGLTNITLNKQLNTICENVFAYCEKLQCINLEQTSVKIIKQLAFHHSNLKKIYLPQTFDVNDKEVIISDAFQLSNIRTIYLKYVPKNKHKDLMTNLQKQFKNKTVNILTNDKHDFGLMISII